MFQNKKVAVVMPAYNAEKTIVRTYEEARRQQFVDEIVIVDDASGDRTEIVSKSLPDAVFVRHEENLGYGGNQKTCYRIALERGADIVVMVHPDYQYTPLLIPAMASMIGGGLYHCVLGSRILGGWALKGGMPLYKYVSNRALTFFENLLLGAKLSEYHTGYRAFSRELLEALPLNENDNDFIFDNQMLAQIVWSGCVIGEVSCPTKYFEEASSINFGRSVTYGLGCVATSLQFALRRLGWISSPRFPQELRKKFAPAAARAFHMRDEE